MNFLTKLLITDNEIDKKLAARTRELVNEVKNGFDGVNDNIKCEHDDTREFVGKLAVQLAENTSAECKTLREDLAIGHSKVVKTTTELAKTNELAAKNIVAAGKINHEEIIVLLKNEQDCVKVTTALTVKLAELQVEFDAVQAKAKIRETEAELREAELEAIKSIAEAEAKVSANTIADKDKTIAAQNEQLGKSLELLGTERKITSFYREKDFQATPAGGKSNDMHDKTCYQSDDNRKTLIFDNVGTAAAVGTNEAIGVSLIISPPPQACDDPAEELAKTNPELGKYLKLIKKGVDNAAIRRDMANVGFPDEIIDIIARLDLRTQIIQEQKDAKQKLSEEAWKNSRKQSTPMTPKQKSMAQKIARLQASGGGGSFIGGISGGLSQLKKTCAISIDNNDSVETATISFNDNDMLKSIEKHRSRICPNSNGSSNFSDDSSNSLCGSPSKQ